MKRYNVLWIDDEHEKMSSFITDAELEEIDIYPFQTSKDGMKSFEEDLFKWDGVILDAKCWNESSDEVASTDGMYFSLNRITELKYKRTVPVFIYTGQPDLYSGEQFLKSMPERKVYKKGSPEDKKQLFVDLKTEANKLIENHMRFIYSDVIGVYNDIDSELVKILSKIHGEITNDTDIFNAIRKVLDWTMSYCNKCGLLPIEFNGSNLGECSYFLGKKEMQQFVPIHIRRCFHSCIQIANNGSHRLDIDNDVRTGKAPYLLRSTAFEMLNILYWCKSLPTNEVLISKMQNDVADLMQIPNKKDIVEEGVKTVVVQCEKANYRRKNYSISHKDGVNKLEKNPIQQSK